jgi:CsoR family transcriptional regulator, copper-sensing transcriptional repressor
LSKLNNADKKRALILRLKRVEGQLRGIQNLIEDEADCEQIAQQLSASRKALDKAFFAMVGCLLDQESADTRKSSAKRGDYISQMLSRFA